MHQPRATHGVRETETSSSSSSVRGTGGLKRQQQYSTTNSLPTSTWYFFSDPKIYIFGFLLLFSSFAARTQNVLLPLFWLAFVHISCKVRNSVFTCDFSLNDSIMHRFFDIFFFMWIGGHGWARVMKVMSFIRMSFWRFIFGAFSFKFTTPSILPLAREWHSHCLVWIRKPFFCCCCHPRSLAYFMRFPLCWRCSSKYLNERKKNTRTAFDHMKNKQIIRFRQMHMCASSGKNVNATKCEWLQ